MKNYIFHILQSIKKNISQKHQSSLSHPLGFMKTIEYLNLIKCEKEIYLCENVINMAEKKNTKWKITSQCHCFVFGGISRLISDIFNCLPPKKFRFLIRTRVRIRG